MKKADKDETAKSFIPEDQEVELLKFIQQQEAMVAEEAAKNQGELEELKDEDDDNVANVQIVKTASDQIDNYLGKYKTADDLKIGDRSLDSLIEVKQKNQ
jgi:hypothetical protein